MVTHRTRTSTVCAHARRGRRRGQLHVKQVQDGVMRRFGLEKLALPSGSKPTYTEAYERYGNCIVTTTKYVAAIVDGALRDIYDGRQYELDSNDHDTGTMAGVYERKALAVWSPLPERERRKLEMLPLVQAQVR